jgi:hypothetical protein
MKTRFAKKIALLIGVTVGSMSMVGAAECDSVGAKVEKAIAKAPDQVLVIVDDMISKNEACSCEIVKAAISASSADKDLVREIVVTAVTAAQGMAATITECAVAQAPEAAAEIKAGLNEAFAGAEADPKEPINPKEPIIVEEATEDFGPEPVVISGVYLIAPVAGNSGGAAFSEASVKAAAAALAKQQRLISLLRRQNRGGNNSGSTTTTSSGPNPSPTNP